jgi:hypothetical protein
MPHQRDSSVKPPEMSGLAFEKFRVDWWFTTFNKKL